MVRVTRHTVADDFGIYIGIAIFSMLKLFQHYDSCTLANDKTITIDIPRSRSLLRCIIKGRGKSLSLRKTVNSKFTNSSFSSTSYHDFSIFPHNHPSCVTDSMSTRRTSCHNRMIRSFETMFDSNVPRH